MNNHLSLEHLVGGDLLYSRNIERTNSTPAEIMDIIRNHNITRFVMATRIVIASRYTFGINLNHVRETFIIEPNGNIYNNKKNPVKHKILQKNIFGFSCSICYDKYKPNDQIYILKCGHF